MPHSYGASFSGVGFLGPRTLESTTEISANPAPSAIMMRMESQPCTSIAASHRLVNDFASQADMLTRLAWFSPLPPARSGVAAYSAELLPYLERRYRIDTFDSAQAHDFVWKHRRDPYDLTVYQLGNAPWHDYMWAYLAAYPGLVVLHDARLHHARARHLMQLQRVDDYRREFRYNHPDAPPSAADYAVEGLRGSIYYFWPMRALVLRTARLVAVHNARVAAELTAEEPT